MDKKMMSTIVIAVVAIVVVAAVALVLTRDNGSDDTEVQGDVVLSSGATLSVSDVAEVLDAEDFTASTIMVGLESKTNTAELKVAPSTLMAIYDKGKGITLATENGTAKILSKNNVKAIADAGTSDVTLKLTITTDSNEITAKLGSKDYSEVRAYAQLDVYSGSAIANVAVEVIYDVPYQFKDEYFESSERALQWDASLNDSAAICSNKSATLVTKTNQAVYLAFMNKADVLYYPVTYTTLINGVAVEQTLNHRPYKVAAFWDNTVELALLFGQKDNLAFAFTELDYTCVNPSLQADFDSERVQSVIRYGPQSTISAYKEWFRTNGIDFIFGWSSTFQDTDNGGLGNYQLLNSWGITGIVTNRPSNSVDDYFTVLDNVGKALNMKAKADEVKANFQSAIDSFNSILAEKGITDDQRRGAVLIEVSDRGVGTYGGDYITGQMLDLAGGKNLFPADSMGRTDAEGLVKTCLPNGEDDIYLIILQTSDDAKIQQFREDPKFATLVEKADNIVGLGFGVTYFGGVLSNTLLYQYFNLLYPEYAVEIPAL